MLADVGREGVADVGPVRVVLDENRGTGKIGAHVRRWLRGQVGRLAAPALSGDPAQECPTQGLDHSTNGVVRFAKVADRQPVRTGLVRSNDVDTEGQA